MPGTYAWNKMEIGDLIAANGGYNLTSCFEEMWVMDLHCLYVVRMSGSANTPVSRLQQSGVMN